MKKYSQLTIILSNCLSGGTAWNTIESVLTKDLFANLSRIEGLDFKYVNSNSVRGEHNSFTIILTSAFYYLSNAPSQTKASRLLEYVRNAANQIMELTYSEIRIEHTRFISDFSDFEHQSLAKMV
jgi:hypothetical protein